MTSMIIVRKTTSLLEVLIHNFRF